MLRLEGHIVKVSARLNAASQLVRRVEFEVPDNDTTEFNGLYPLQKLPLIVTMTVDTTKIGGRAE